MNNEKSFAIAFAFMLSLFFLSCVGIQEKLTPVGDWVFWTDSPIKSTKIHVVFTSTIQGDITGVNSSIPPCDNFESYTVNLEDLGITSNKPEGTFAFTATDGVAPNILKSWSGSIVVTKDNYEHCNSRLLH